jgi:microcystin-dependent protein
MNPEPFLGQIQPFPYNFAPTGWHLCDGTLIQINQNQALFALLGTQFGGNGTTTFGLPKIPDIGPGVRYFIAVQGIFPSRN